MAAIWSTYFEVSKTLEHLGFMEFEGETQECKREDDSSSRRRTCPWFIVAARSKLIMGEENKKLTGSNTTMKKHKDETGKLVSSTRVWMLLR